MKRVEPRDIKEISDRVDTALVHIDPNTPAFKLLTEVQIILDDIQASGRPKPKRSVKQ